MTRHCICRNASKAPINNSGTPKLTLVVFCTSNFSLTQSPTFTSIPASGLLERYIGKDLQRAIKLVLEFFVKGQEHGPL